MRDAFPSHPVPVPEPPPPPGPEAAFLVNQPDPAESLAEDSQSSSIDPLSALASIGGEQYSGAPFRTLADPDPLARVRTMIPLLMTGSLLLVVTAILQWVVEPENPLAAPFTACPYILILIGLLIGAVAAGNMMNVRKATNDRKRVIGR